MTRVPSGGGADRGEAVHVCRQGTHEDPVIAPPLCSGSKMALKRVLLEKRGRNGGGVLCSTFSLCYNKAKEARHGS